MLYSPFYRWDTWVLREVKRFVPKHRASSGKSRIWTQVGLQYLALSTVMLSLLTMAIVALESCIFKCKHPVPLTLLQRVFFQLLSYVMFWGTSIQETVYTLWTLNEGKWPFSVVRKIAQVKRISRFLWRNTFTFILRNQRKMMKIRRI